VFGDETKQYIRTTQHASKSCDRQQPRLRRWR